MNTIPFQLVKITPEQTCIENAICFRAATEVSIALSKYIWLFEGAVPLQRFGINIFVLRNKTDAFKKKVSLMEDSLLQK